jgi:hypothetical protein
LLLISQTRNLARFYKSEYEIENCSYKIAKRLLQEGYVEEVGEHEKGLLYGLSDSKKDEVASFKIADKKNKDLKKVDFQDDEDEDDDDAEYDLEEDLGDDLEEESLKSDQEEDEEESPLEDT